MALPPKLIGPSISLITGLITSTAMSFVGLRAAATDVDDRRPADPALRHAAGRIAGSRRTKRNPRRKPGPPIRFLRSAT